MLSDFVVTTVDHLLFGAMRSPHLAMRHLGLSRKVVIVDEVHSYSTYMNVYLDRVLTWLAAYGVPVVLLSATLSEARCTPWSTPIDGACVCRLENESPHAPTSRPCAPPSPAWSPPAESGSRSSDVGGRR